MSKTIVDANVLIDCFDRDSAHREASIRFVEHMVRERKLMTLPAHGWFEVWCTMNRLTEIERRYISPVIAGGQQLPIELIHIDAQFIKKYGNLRIPYIKGGDHIYLVIAHVNGYRLITRDARMQRVAKELGITVSSPAEYLEALT